MEKRGSDAARLLLAAARERFSVASIDLLLPEQARLTEWQRVTAAALLAQLIRTIEDRLRTEVAPLFDDNPEVRAALTSAHVAIALPALERANVLRDGDLGNLLVRRVEEHRYHKAHGRVGEDVLQGLIADADPDISAQAMTLLIARSRRFDRFQEPVMAETELPAEFQHELVWLVAAALRDYLVGRHGLDGSTVDAAMAPTATALLGDYDEGASLESCCIRLAASLDRQGRLDDDLLDRMLGEGLLPLFTAGIARRARIESAAAWELLADPQGRGPALLLRAAGVERDAAAAILLALNSRGRLFSGAEADATESQLAIFESLDREEAEAVLQPWRVDPGYRAAIARLSTRQGRGG